MCLKARLGALVLLVLQASPAQAQPAAPDEPQGPTEVSWSFSLEALGYILPSAEFFVSPTATADWDWLHLEARYNYEALRTGSAWVGRNFSFGKSVELNLTPMLGGVFGQVRGFAPGFQAELTYRWLGLSSSGEYLFDLQDRSQSFLYNWSEAWCAPAPWFRAGLVAQRTKVYQSRLQIQPGLLLGFSTEHFTFTTYAFDVGLAEPTIVLSLEYTR